jgi:hypothetical protein
MDLSSACKALASNNNTYAKGRVAIRGGAKSGGKSSKASPKKMANIPVTKSSGRGRPKSDPDTDLDEVTDGHLIIDRSKNLLGFHHKPNVSYCGWVAMGYVHQRPFEPVTVEALQEK